MALAHTTDGSGGDLLDAIEKGGIVSVGSSTPIPTDSTAWAHWRTDLNALEIKLRTGTEGSYSYAVSRRLFSGDSQSRAFYHTADDPPALSVTWNSNNNNVNVTSGGWTEDPMNAKWVHIAVLRGDSANTVQIIPRIRMEDPDGSERFQFLCLELLEIYHLRLAMFKN